MLGGRWKVVGDSMHANGGGGERFHHEGTKSTKGRRRRWQVVVGERAQARGRPGMVRHGQHHAPAVPGGLVPPEREVQSEPAFTQV